ncbi:ABC transporter substrate-binding protein [Desulfolucanica intricata]|uniref:ABC transporter substrate-binding protein n=1 Tax=Desulfolucanica intricata TaxID=1285191 RepID=UPI00082B7510|nr:ABC transporter substrate-binding protein [Desulfolucanica intricata]
MRFNFKWPILIILILVFSLSTVFYFYGQGKKQKTVSKDSIMVLESSRSLCYLPQYIAMEKGFFKEQNLDVELKTAPTPEAVTAAFKNQNPAFILCGMEAAVNYSSDSSTGPAAIAALTARENSFVLGRKDHKGFSWNDVKGKSIIVDGPDTLQNMVLENILRQKDIGPNYQVNIIQNLPNNLQRGVFKSGTATFIVMTEPEATMLENAGEGKVVASLGVEGGEIPAAVLLSNQHFLKSHPGAAQKYTNAIYKARLWMNHHNTKETIKLIEDYFPEVEPDTLITAIERYKAQRTWAQTPVISKTEYDRLLKIMADSGELVKPKNYEELVNNQFAEKAIKNVTYRPPEKKEKKKFPFSLWDK